MDGGENLVKAVEEILPQLTPEELTTALPRLEEIINKYLAKGKTLVLKGQPISEQTTDEKGNLEATNKYEIRGKLGQGGMGAVYRAYDAQLKREVALKILLEKDDEMLQRFADERVITAQLDHPCFLPVHTVGHMDTPKGKMPFYTMDLVRGDSLEKLIKMRGMPGEKGEKLRSKFTLFRLLQITQQVCSALQSAHDKGIIHRDLKPSNVMVGPYDNVYVVDLGLVKMIKASEIVSGRFEANVEKHFKEPQHMPQKDLTGNSGLGTRYYMAPEQLLAPKKVDHRTDIFGIGGILYSVLTGQDPEYVERKFNNEILEEKKTQIMRALQKYGNVTQLVLTPLSDLAPEVRSLVEDYHQCDGLMLGSTYYKFSMVMKDCTIIPPSRVVAERRERLKVLAESGISAIMPDPVDPALEAVCMKALRKNPDDRYQSCNEIKEALQQFIEGNSELILENEAKDLTKVMSKQNLDKTLEDLEIAEMKVQESINKLEKIKRMALEEKLKMIDLQILKVRVYDQRGQSSLIIDTIEKAKHLIESPLNAAQRQYIRLQIVEGLAKFNDKEYDKAKEIQLKAIELCKLHPEKKLLVSAYHNYAMACLYDFSKRQNDLDFSNARQAFNDCYKLADQLGDIFSAVHARTMLVNLLLEKNEYQKERQSILQDALKIAAGDNSLTAEVHTLFSWHYLRQNNYHDSIHHGEVAVELADKADNQINLHEARLAIGQAYHHIGNTEKRTQNLKPVLSFTYAREPLSYEDAVKEFYAKNSLNLKELE